MLRNGFLIDNRQFTKADELNFQTALMKVQMSLEDIWLEYCISSLDRPTVIICDRGIMDGYAYTNKETWQLILDEQGWNQIHLRDRRYEAVIHLVTAADGADRFYDYGDQSSNNARYEGLEEAKVVDRKL